jgi:hypothetical protein
MSSSFISFNQLKISYENSIHSTSFDILLYFVVIIYDIGAFMLKR